MTARNERLRERQKALGLEPVQTVLHPDDKAALLEYAYQLRVKRGTLTPTDIKRVNDAAIDDLPAPATIPTDSQILEALPVQTVSIDPTIAQTKIDGVVAVVARFEAIKKTETSPRWEKAVQFIRDIKEALS